MNSAVAGLEATVPGRRNAALNAAAWTLCQWVAAAALEQGDVGDDLYATAVLNGLVGDASWCRQFPRLVVALEYPQDGEAFHFALSRLLKVTVVQQYQPRSPSTRPVNMASPLARMCSTASSHSSSASGRLPWHHARWAKLARAKPTPC
jgi:hypothetical protein